MSNSSFAARRADLADVAVVGAGVVGAACAHALARAGFSVVLIDRQAPGHGASFGNAGHLATEQVFPVADFSILKRLPRMLLDPMGPLRLDWRYLPRAVPWLTRLLLNLREGPFRRTVAGLRALNQQSLAAWERLLTQIGAPALLHRDGSLLVFERPDSLPAVHALQQRMVRQEVALARWDAEAVQAALPQLSPSIRGGLFFPDTGHFIDPYRVVCKLVEAARQRGVELITGAVEEARLCEDGVALRTAGGELRARKALIACGAHSARLTAMLTGKRVPLDTERGYHLMLPRELGRLPFAVTSFERRFIMTPMQGGLRLAGTVEFAGLERAPAMARAWQLHALSRGLFIDDLDASEAVPWMGFRPSLPDSLPVIDQACEGRVLLAFGHHHLGMTQAAVTAEAVTRMALGASAHGGGAPALPMTLYALSRF